MNLEKFKPCRKGLAYYKQFNSFKDAWDSCHRGDWMLWIAQKLKVDIKILTKAKALCAKTVEHLMKDERSIKALEVALLFSEGKATKEELDKAYVDAYAAYIDADDATAYNAADAAYNAADAAYNAAYTAAAAAYAVAYAAATYATYATYATATYATAAYADAAKKENQLLTANICREILTKAVMEAIDD